MERGPPRGDCDVNVKVDGTDIGTFRLPNMKSILVRRPVFAQQKFLLVRAGSWDALKAGATKDAPKNGEIQVIFHPEDTGPVEQCSRMEDQSAAGMKYPRVSSDDTCSYPAWCQERSKVFDRLCSQQDTHFRDNEHQVQVWDEIPDLYPPLG